MRKPGLNSSQEIKDNKIEYNNKVKSTLDSTNFSDNPSDYWKTLTKICTDSANNFTTNTKARFNNSEISKLSVKQKELRLQIDTSKDPTQKKNLKTKRNKILKDQHKLVKQKYEEKLESQILDIEHSKDDSHRMFKAIKIIQQKRKTEPII